MRLGDVRERERPPRRQEAGPAHVDVEPCVGCGGVNVERLCRRPQCLSDRPGRLDRAVEPGRSDGAAVDRRNLVRMQRGEADFEHVMGAAPRMQYDAPPSFAVRVDDIPDLGRDAGLGERGDDEIALPRAVAAHFKCCTTHPPHTPKCGQIGVMRSWLASSTRSRRRRSGWPGQSPTSTVSPGSA